jgi:cell division protein FtsB
MSARSTWLRRIGIAAAVAFAMGYVPYHLYARSGLARYVRLKSERDALHAANLKLYDEHQRLRQELDTLSPPSSTEPSRAVIERAARDELGLVKPGEIVFKLESPTK